MKPTVYVETTVISYLVGRLSRTDIHRLLAELRLLRVPDAAYELQLQLLRRTRIPAKARNDALHIAVATVHGVEFLATWNCKHIANAVTLPLVYDVCREAGYEPPLVCTPYELLGETDDEEI